MAPMLGMTGYGGAIFGAGAGLAAAGLQRGGISGLAMSTAGGAIIGMQYGGPLGAAIGAGVGAIAGMARLFVKGAQDKAREKIKALYGVEIRDKGILKQIVDTAKQSFGGNLDMTIRSPRIRELIELYAMTTAQSMTPGNLMRPATMYQSGGILYSQPNYSNGMPLPASTPAPSSGPTYIQLDPEATREFLSGRMAETIRSNPRAVASSNVASSNLEATKQNYARRQTMALQFSPSSLTV